MAHPQMFDDDDPMLARVRRLALALPGAAERISHGRPAFHTTKVFAYYGASVRLDRRHEQHPQSLVVLLGLAERTAQLHEPGCFVPAYLGPSGWVGVDLVGADWAEVAELLEESFRATAPARLVAELAARGGPGTGEVGAR